MLTSTTKAASDQVSKLLPPMVIKSVEEKFPNSQILANSAKCKISTSGAILIGIILQQADKLHAVIAVSSENHRSLFDMPKNVEYSRGATVDFLGEFDTADARKQLEIRCVNPKNDTDINIDSNGAFINHKGEEGSAKHLCFQASAIYNSWVCYWMKPNAMKPELSFVQFNAD